MSDPGHWGFFSPDVTPDTPPCQECGKEPMIFDDGENFECHRYTCSVTLLRYPMLLLNTGQAPSAWTAKRPPHAGTWAAQSRRGQNRLTVARQDDDQGITIIQRRRVDAPPHLWHLHSRALPSSGGAAMDKSPARGPGSRFQYPKGPVRRDGFQVGFGLRICPPVGGP